MSFRIASEEVLHKRYITVYNRKLEVQRPGAEPLYVEYDVAGHPRCDFRFCVVFPFHSARNGEPASVTLIQEYMQGPNSLGITLPCGGFDPKKHSSMDDTARAELSEEAQLHKGKLVRLIDDDHPGLVETKWCRNRFIPYLCIDPEEDPSPGQRDIEEFSLKLLRVPVARLEEEILFGGEVLGPSLATAVLALRRLRKEGLLGPQPLL